MTDSNTPASSPATITEKELWAVFVSNWMQTTFAASSTVAVYRPDERLRDGGANNGTLELCDAIADELLASDYPIDDLEVRLADLRNYVANLEEIHSIFHQLKMSLEVETDDDETRYRIPTIHKAHEDEAWSKGSAA